MSLQDYKCPCCGGSIEFSSETQKMKCPYCIKVMNYMKEKGIKFHKFDTSNSDNVLRLLSVGGKDQVPFLYNEDTNDKLYESDDIIDYLKTLKGVKDDAGI